MKKIWNWFERFFFPVTILFVGVMYISFGNGAEVYGDSIQKGLAQAKLLFGVNAGAMSQDVALINGNISDSTVLDPEDFQTNHMDEFVELLDNDTGILGNEQVNQDLQENEQSQENELPQGTEQSGENELSQETESLPEDISEEEISIEEPAYITVDPSDFSNSAFIGDSRVVGLMKYGELDEYAQFYASTGLTIHKLFQAQIALVEGKIGKQTLDVALSERQFDRIYLCIGINEMGTGDVDFFIDAYCAAIDRIRELQPDAKIYIQSIIAVTQKRSDKKDYINNEGIYERNKRLKELADQQTIFYLDINSVLCDENGAMIEDYTSDGVHLKAQYLALWRDYLLSHVVE